MLESLLEVAEKLVISQGAKDDDGVDRMHHMVTVALFAFLGIGVAAKQYVGDPIHCWSPAQFTDSHKSYTEGYCWISHMYYVPMDEIVPVKIEDRMMRDISFYRWVAFVFLLQALMFKLPNIMWMELKTYSGINVEKIVKMADDAMMSPPKDRPQKINDIARFIDRWLTTYRVYKYNVLIRIRQKVSGIICFVFGKRHGTYLTGLYLFCKLLNVVNVIGQFFLLSSFLGWEFWTYGIEIINILRDKGHWEDWRHFPRVAMCDFEIRQLQNIQRYSVQCALSINLFVEKMYAFTWFWLLLLAVATVLNFGKWCYNSIFRSRGELFVRKFLTPLDGHEPLTSSEQRLTTRFIKSYLRDDGVFLLRAVSNNAGHIVTLELVDSLWKMFKENHLGPPDYNESKPRVANSNK